MSLNTDRLVQLFGLRDKTALVTGGSRGIGYMIAGGLLDAGCRVIISSRKAEQLHAAAAQLAEDHQGECTPITADLSTVAGCEALAEEVTELAPSLPILVNNAGASWGHPIDDFPVHGWDKVMDVNLRGPFVMTQKLLGPLRAAASAEDPARVINIASVNGIAPPSLETYSYSASKAGVIMLTRHLGSRLAPEHITVNAIAPGPFDSKMMAFILNDPSARAELASEVPLGRIGQPDDMAGVAVYLASRAGSYLTGAVIPVGGGMACVESGERL